MGPIGFYFRITINDFLRFPWCLILLLSRLNTAHHLKHFINYSYVLTVSFLFPIISLVISRSCSVSHFSGFVQLSYPFLFFWYSPVWRAVLYHAESDVHRRLRSELWAVWNEQKALVLRASLFWILFCGSKLFIIFLGGISVVIERDGSLHGFAREILFIDTTLLIPLTSTVSVWPRTLMNDQELPSPAVLFLTDLFPAWRHSVRWQYLECQYRWGLLYRCLMKGCAYSFLAVLAALSTLFRTCRNCFITFNIFCVEMSWLLSLT